MKKARYICFEGTEGVGKTTQTQKLVDVLRSQGYKVLQTKEPGTQHAPLTMILRGIMLDNQYDSVLTRPAREFISQAIRSIHLENVIVPAIYEYDFIIQDRGILSGYAYGEACGNSFDNLYFMAIQNIDSADNNKDILPIKPELIYDSVIYLRGDSIKGLQKALSAKQEFETGDAMESRGNSFMNKVSKNMDEMSSRFNTVRIDVDGKSIEEVHNEILTCLEIKDI
jgi:dTMP kinase